MFSKQPLFIFIYFTLTLFTFTIAELKFLDKAVKYSDETGDSHLTFEEIVLSKG
jgi:hypothetical protein